MDFLNFVVPFSLILLAGIMSPGPAFVVVIQDSLTMPLLNSFSSVLGIALANTFFALFSALGLLYLLEHRDVLRVVNLLGASYLLYISYKMYSTQVVLGGNTKNQPSRHTLSRLFSSTLFQLSNIKAFFFISSAVSALSQHPESTKHLFIVAFVTFTVSFMWYGIVSLFSRLGYVRKMLSSNVSLISQFGSFIIFIVSMKILLDVF